MAGAVQWQRQYSLLNTYLQYTITFPQRHCLSRIIITPNSNNLTRLSPSFLITIRQVWDGTQLHRQPAITIVPVASMRKERGGVASSSILVPPGMSREDSATRGVM